ncbi:hypothetical protein HK405_007325 [Cladochytrium tenue]|nr:hypothetical protein HK405_007325 [Cladochytrium tenue]
MIDSRLLLRLPRRSVAAAVTGVRRPTPAARAFASSSSSSSPSSSPLASSAAPPSSVAQGRVIYQGPLFQRIQQLKRVSVATLVLTIGSTPLFASAAGDGSAAAAVVLAATIAVSGTSTALIQYCCSPYVGRIVVEGAEEGHRQASPTEAATTDDIRDDAELTIETTGFFGNTRATRVRAAALQPATASRFANWRLPTPQQQQQQQQQQGAGGGLGRRLYVDPVAEGASPEFARLVDRVGGPAAAAAAEARMAAAAAEERAAGDDAATGSLDALVDGLQKGR